MRVLRLAAMIFAIVGGYLALPGPASAAPLGAGALPFVQTELQRATDSTRKNEVVSFAKRQREENGI